MVIEAAGGQLCEDKKTVTASTILLAGEEDHKLFKTSKTNPWAPATELQNKDFVKFSILRHKLDRKTYKWKQLLREREEEGRGAVAGGIELRRERERRTHTPKNGRIL